MPDVLPLLDFDYDERYGGQQLFGNVWYSDGSVRWFAKNEVWWWDTYLWDIQQITDFWADALDEAY